MLCTFHVRANFSKQLQAKISDAEVRTAVKTLLRRLYLNDTMLEADRDLAKKQGRELHKDHVVHRTEKQVDTTVQAIMSILKKHNLEDAKAYLLKYYLREDRRIMWMYVYTSKLPGCK